MNLYVVLRFLLLTPVALQLGAGGEDQLTTYGLLAPATHKSATIYDVSQPVEGG